MREQLKQFGSRIFGSPDDQAAGTKLTTLRAAAAELLVATAIESAFGQFTDRNRRSASTPRALSWAPILLAPLTAAAHVEHARNPREESATALRILNTATVAIGGALLLYELLDGNASSKQLGPLSLASAGLLGFALDVEEQEVHRTERQLRQRARMVERLVPQRRARLDHVVVHV